MADPIKYQRPPVELAGAMDAYLYGCTPAEDCGVCASLMHELDDAKKAEDWGKAYDAAAAVRNHPRHDQRPRSISATGSPCSAPVVTK
ncbi:hypothetical protein [Streptomyces sp. NPDC050485]|uniref:hypothetical protein n=1 Tax=Streptomyces sp. NPDC050485 TaxID=3365617 RepID=UPI0037981496